jgi:hypothetical protein
VPPGDVICIGIFRAPLPACPNAFHWRQHRSNSSFDASSDPARLPVRRFSCEIKGLQRMEDEDV